MDKVNDGGPAFSMSDKQIMFTALCRIAMGEDAPQKIADDAIAASRKAAIADLAARPSRGVVDEVALAEVIQDHTGCGDSDSIYAAHAVIQHLQAAAYASYHTHDYLPKTATEAKSWEPHQWVIDAIQAASLDAQSAVPDGWVLVPEAATHAMILAGVAAANRMDLRPLWGDLEEAWNAMLAATPAHDQPEGAPLAFNCSNAVTGKPGTRCYKWCGSRACISTEDNPNG